MLTVTQLLLEALSALDSIASYSYHLCAKVMNHCTFGKQISTIVLSSRWNIKQQFLFPTTLYRAEFLTSKTDWTGGQNCPEPVC